MFSVFKVKISFAKSLIVSFTNHIDYYFVNHFIKNTRNISADFLFSWNVKRISNMFFIRDHYIFVFGIILLALLHYTCFENNNNKNRSKNHKRFNRYFN